MRKRSVEWVERLVRRSRQGESGRETRYFPRRLRWGFILTPNFLNNNGWTKREYDSVFTRELVEKKKVILPVWHNVSVEDVYKYSPILADRLGAQWAEGVEEVSRKLLVAIDAKEA